ncbi:hypothetical protein [Streptomyces sp. NRRL B-24484]|uniref:hypothetical protein n=1 Tax=Streptomyces sp. NRRL B-24484 TaxID=1463833 RepID=UPI0004BF9C13|nr:hypothetical protein [Streptomyces sp. NRRL B-24484]
MTSPRSRKVTYDAPVGSVDLPAFDENGAPYEVWPCTDCLPWHFEVIRADDGEVMVREWHAMECALFQQLISDQ